MTARDLSDTRVGWVNQNPGSRTTFSHVPYDEMASDERTWRVVDALNGVAKESGEIIPSLQWHYINVVVSQITGESIVRAVACSG